MSAEVLPLLGRRTCGACAHSRVNSSQLGQIICFGAPPVPVVVGMSPQGPAINCLRPILSAKEEACGRFQAKSGEALAQSLRVEGNA